MTQFNLNRMLQGCSAFIQTMAGDRAARNDAKRVNNHVLPLTCPLLASSLRLTYPLQLRRIALILCVLVMSMANVGMAWGADVHYILVSQGYAPLTKKTMDASYNVLKTDGTTIGKVTSVSSSITTAASLYYNSTSSTYTNLTNTSNYGTSSGDNNTLKGINIGSGKTATINLGSQTFTKIDVIYRCNSSSAGTLTIAGEDVATSSTSVGLKTKTGSFSSSFTIKATSQDYRVVVILTREYSPSYSVTYDANGGSGVAPSDANTYESDDPVTVLEKNTLSKSGYFFSGWNTKANGTGTAYSPGEKMYTGANNVTLYAQWADELDLKYVWKVTGKFCDDQSTSTASVNMISDNDYFTLTGTGYKQESGSSLNLGSTAGNNFLITAKSGYKIKSICFYGKIQDASVYKTTDGSDWSGTITSTGTSSDKHYSFEDINATCFGVKLSGTSGIWIRNMVITVAVAAAPAETWVVAGQWDSYSTSTNTLTGSGTLSTTISLPANKRYEFKIVETIGNTWYGNSGAIIGDMTNWTMSTDKNNCRLHTGPAGDYTFTFDPSTKNLSVTYPSVTHPSDYYVYFKNSDVWGTVYGFMTGGSGDFAGWPGTVTNTTTICGETYHYGALLNNDGTYNKIIFNNGGSGYGNQTSDLSISGAGKYNANRDANWHEFSIYSISFNAGGGTGTMDAIEGLCPNSNQALPANTFEKTDNIFSGWHANVATKVGGSTVAIGGDIADEATLQEINSNIILTAQWTACSGPTINSFVPTGKTDGTYEVGTTLGSITVTATAGNGGALSYLWYQYDGGDIGAAVAAAGTNNAATYNIPNDVACVSRHYFCIVSEAGCSTTRTSDASGALTLTEPVDPCTEPEKVANEIARFFVPCGTGQIKYEVTNANASTNDNTFTTVKLGSTNADGWYVNPTSGLKYAKLTSSDSYIQIKLKSGSFQAGDVVTAYFNANNGTKTGLKLKSTDGNGNEPSATAKEVETSSTYTLVAADIETDGSIKLFRAGSATYVNRIIVTRAPVAASITATLLTPAYMPTGSSGVQIGVEITGASTGWKYRVKNGSDGYEAPDNTAYTTTTWTMTSTIGPGANTYVVELYDGTDTKQATSTTITVTGETTHPVTITAGANGTVSPSGVVQANGSHIQPEITATPNSGYRFVNWTLSNSNATLADATSATTTITNATGACEITANFEANPTALVHWTMNVTTDAAWGTSATSTTDGTNITSIGTSHSEGNNAAKNSATAKTAMAAEEVTTTAAPTNSANFTFTIAGGKQVEPEKVTCQVFNVSSGSRTYKAQISDTNGHVYNSTNTVAVTEEAELTDATFNFASDLVLTGTVTVKIYAWGSGSEFRMGPDVKLFGEVQTALTYTLTASATVSNPMTADSKTGAITGSFTNNPVTAITSGTTTSTSDNTFTVNKTTPVTVTAAETIDGTEAQCDECTYVFYSWENIPATVTADVSTIHAIYKTTYTISFKETDESAVAGVSGTSYVYGEGKAANTLPTPSKSGYTFDGWYKENTLTNAATDIDDDAWGNITYYAKWTENTGNKVTYNGNGNTSGDVPTDDTDYAAGDIVTVKGNTGSLVKTGQTFLGWSTSATASSGTFYPAGYKFEMPASNVTLYAVWGSAAEEKYYYGQVGIADGALVKGAANTLMFFTNEGGVIASSTALTMTTSNLGTGPSCYYNSNDLTHTGLNKSSNWGTGSGSNKYIRGLKWANGKSYTLGLGTKAATSIMFYGWAGAADKTLTIGGVEYTSTGTSFFSNDFTKVGNFTDNVTIACGGDFYGILVITISTGAASGHTVSFNMNGHGSAIDAIANVPSGSMIGKPIPDPAAVDWEFGGWYNEAGCTSAFDFATTTITADKTLYAQWTNCAPTVTTQPVAASYAQNATATALTVAANDNGGGVLHYQWWVKENDLDEETGSAIPGETGTSFTPSTELLGTSYYYCVVSNDCGNVFSNTAGITITDARPNPKANWNVDEPTHGGKGFSFSVEVNKNDDSNWDGTLDASMLTLSSEAVLGDVTVDNDTKTISGTYGVKGSATSPVTFYLLLPATATQAAARLDYDRSFDVCEGGSGDSYNIRVRKTAVTDKSNNYRWVTTGAGEITYTVGSSISSGKLGTAIASVFDSCYSSGKSKAYIRTYNANINKVRVHGYLENSSVTVTSVHKMTSWAEASDANKLSASAYTIVYNGDAEEENLGTSKASHYVDITFNTPLSANDIICVKFSNNVKVAGAVLTEARSGGELTTSLEWSNSQANGATLEKREDAVDFAVTANRNDANALASLGTISYSSSNTSVATVNAATGQVTIADNIDFGSADYKTTTITATLAASGCYKRCVLTYVLQVNKYVCTEAVGTVSIQTDNGCDGKVLAVSGYTDGATIQWYKDGASLGASATSTTYTATEGGTYYVVTTKSCDAVSNEITITFGTATATKIVDEWYVKNGRRTPDIALVQTTNATSFTVTSGGSPIDNIGGCKFYLGTDGIIYLKGQQDDGTEPSGLTAGEETITITASACEAASGLDIVIHKQEQRGDGKPEIAFVVDGTLRKDGGTATSVLASKTSERPIWTFLSTYYSLTGCNAYWSVNSKELRQYYSQFDAILITDDPNTSTEGTGGVSYVKAFGTMVDVRPVLTMEAYVGKFKDGGWHVYNATPSSPNPRQVEMKLECKNHDIFVGLNPSTMDNVRTETINGDEYWFVTMVDTTQSPYHNTKDDYEALPALQGFDKTKFSNMLGVGTIKNDELQAGVERQEEPAARMMILGIQNNAMAALTTEGKMVVKNALDYLLKTDMEDVNDCANYFLGTTNNQWNVASNWSRNEVPDFETRARILRPVVVPNDYSARVARVDIASDGPSKKLSGAECTGSLTISQLGALVVSGKVSRVHAPYYGVNDLMPTEVSDVAILSGTGGNGTLIMDDASGENKAYVQMYSKAVKGSPTTWQYIGIPHSDVGNAMDNYYDSWLYSWNPSNGWEVVLRGAAVTPWTGYCITYPTFGHKYEMTGTLVATADVDIDVPANSYQIIGNSWVAPIQIANFEDEDFGDIPKTVYFFNTGSDTGGSGAVSGNATGETRWAAGTYVAVPIHMAEYTGEDKIIPSMQGFYVANTGSAGTLHLDYDKLVRQHGVSNYIQGQMHAPRRIAKASNDPVMLKMIVRGSRYDDRLIVAEREDFTKGHDDGWDGAKWDGSTISPTIWSQNEEGGVESVTATPDMEGTIIGFRAGEDNEYTFHFEYDDMAEPLFLLDMDERMYVRILTGTTYTFTCADKGEHNRFLLTRKAPGIPTGCEPIDGGGGPKAMKFIKDNKLYILLNGVLYDATGKVVE